MVSTSLEHKHRKQGPGVHLHLPPLFLTNYYFRPSGTSPARISSQGPAYLLPPASRGQASQIKKEGR